MNYNDFENKIIAIKEELNNFLNLDFKSNKIRIGEYDIKKALLEFNNFVNTQKYEQALSSFTNNIYEFINIGSVSTKEDILNDRHKELYDYFELIKNVIKLSDSYDNTGFSDFIDRFRTLPFFTDEELGNKNLDHSIQVYIERAMNKKLFKSYRYINGDTELNPTDNIVFYPNIGISENIEGWLNFLKKQQTFTQSNKDTIFATLFLKLDDIEPHFSNFLITLHKNDSVWVCSDELEFHNPHNKVAQSIRGASSGKIERKKEDHYNNIGLPYRLVWEILETKNQLIKTDHYYKIDLTEKVKAISENYGYFDREKNNDVIKTQFDKLVEIELEKLGLYSNSNYINKFDGFNKKIISIIYKFNGRKIAVFQAENNGILTIYIKPEIIVFDIAKLDSLEKFYYVNLVDRLLEEIYNNPPKETVLLASDYLTQKLIGNEKFNHNDEGFSGYGKHIITEVEELLEDKELTETGLVPFNYDIVLSTSSFDANMLSTTSKLENNLKWNVLDDKRKVLQTKINTLTNNRKTDCETLIKIFYNNLEILYKTVFIANHVYFEKTGPTGTFGSDHSNHVINKFATKIIKKEHKRTSSIALNKTVYEKEICPCCNKYYSLHQYNFDIRSYKDIMFVLGLTNRAQIPPYYRNYRAFDMIHYRGNSILDNNHPYSRLTDPCSKQNPNGLNFSIFLCNKCMKNYHNKYKKFDTAKINIETGIVEKYN